MAKLAKSNRLKVYVTQIGFHDWLVAAPNQKAALQAWDVKENLFAIGSARLVTDKDCIGLAMKTPGTPVPADAGHDFAKATRIVRLDDRRRKKLAAKRTPAPKVSKPDRRELDKAEDALEEFRRRSVRERAAILRERKALDLRAEELEEDLEIKLTRLEEALEEARERYDAEAKGA